MRTLDQIIGIYEDRKRYSSPTIEGMRYIKQVVNGDLVIPLPELNKAEKPAVPNLIAEGIEQTAMRVSSTMPNLTYPALNPRSDASNNRADRRRLANLGWWAENDMRGKLQRISLYMVAYATAPIQVRPNFRTRIPEWVVRHPLHTYPAPMEDPDAIRPEDCIFAYRRTRQWLEYNYPDKVATLWKGDPNAWRYGTGPDSYQDQTFELLEYVDHEEYILVVRGAPDIEGFWATTPEYRGAQHAVILERVPNRGGMCPVVTPKRLTLDRLVGQFNNTIGMYQGMAQLMALDLIAVQKAVFPDMVVVGTQGRNPQLLNDEWKAGISGEMNEIIDGEVKYIQLNPGFKTGESMDRLERAIRLTGGVPAQYGGENVTNTRTGRQSEILLSSQVDFRIAQYQNTLARNLQESNKIAVSVAKGFFGDERKHLYVTGFKATNRDVDYVPNEVFGETDYNLVTYSMPGTDVNGMSQALGQRMGMGVMSRKTAMFIDPLIEDPERESDAVMGQGLEDALMDKIRADIAQGTIAAVDIANMWRKVMEQNMPLAKAVEQAQRDAQERQMAEQQAMPPEAGAPGLEAPGMTGVEAGSAIPPAPEGIQNLSGLLNNLRTGAGRQAPPMALPPGGGP